MEIRKVSMDFEKGAGVNTGRMELTQQVAHLGRRKHHTRALPPDQAWQGGIPNIAQHSSPRFHTPEVIRQSTKHRNAVQM